MPSLLTKTYQQNYVLHHNRGAKDYSSQPIGEMNRKTTRKDSFMFGMEEKIPSESNHLPVMTEKCNALINCVANNSANHD